MSEPNIKNVQELLRRNREVKNLTDKAGKSQELQRALTLVLPTMLADYCQARRFDGGVLYLDAATGSVATQLRFIQSQLVQKLQKTAIFSTLDRVSIRVQSPAQTTRKPGKRTTPPVSAENRQLLEEAAKGISDTALAESLRSLAKTLKGL